MKKILVGLLILTMSLSMAGCSNNKKEETAAPAAEETDTAAEAEEKDDTAEDNASAEDDASKADTAEPAHDASAASALEAAAPLYNGVIRAMYQPDISKDGVSYVPSDSQFFWLSVYFTANQLGDTTEGVELTEDNQSLTVPADMIQTYAEGCFGSSQSLPDIPQEVTYIKKDGDNYLVSLTDTGDTGTTITKAYRNSDGTYTAVIEFSTSEDLLSTYQVTFKENTASDALFPYLITGAKFVK